MKKSLYILATAGFLLISLSEIKAQSTQSKLNQMELMKQFLGSWKCNFAKDSVETWIVKPFGKGYELFATQNSKDETYFEEKDLWGYNSRSEIWVLFRLNSQGSYALSYGKFISNNEIVWDGFDIANPEKITEKYGAFFNSTEKFTFIFYTNGKKTKEWTFNRIK